MTEYQYGILKAVQRLCGEQLVWVSGGEIAATCGRPDSAHAALGTLSIKGLCQTKFSGEPDPEPGFNGRRPLTRRGTKVYRLTPHGAAEIAAYEARSAALC